MARLSFVIGTLLLIAACRTLPTNVERETSHALADPDSTWLGQLFAAQIEARQDESGFVPVAAGTSAFLLRSGFAGLAERTLDLQYYIWEEDLTGRMLLRDVLQAAERGVRVRILLDDIPVDGGSELFLKVDAHPHVEVRLFNPFANRDTRILEVVSRGVGLNHRMHNKIMVVDNALAITGGRNIGDNYFGVDEALNFRDLDLLAAGPVVQEFSGMFDAFWNSEWSWPIASILHERRTPQASAALLETLDRWIAKQPALPYEVDENLPAMRARIDSFRDEFLWGPARAVYDSPDKVNGNGEPRVADVLFKTSNEAAHELLIETAYLIPGESGVVILEELVKRGIRIRVLTNSLATNDIIAAHSGYAKYRDDILRAGVEIHELRPDAATEAQRKNVLSSASVATLHTKALIYDRRWVFVGSFNLDPRSLLINTEMGVIVHNRELAARIADMVLEGMRPANSYRLELRDGEVRWHVESEDGEETLDTDPQTSWWERFMAGLLALFPIEGQL